MTDASSQHAAGGEQASPPADQSLPDVRGSINISDLREPVRSDTASIPRMRESRAGWVAIAIIAIFGICLLFSFCIVFFILGILLKTAPSIGNEKVVDKILTGMGSILEVVKVVGTIFSPLLAFILGYYFTMTNRSDKPDASS